MAAKQRGTKGPLAEREPAKRRPGTAPGAIKRALDAAAAAVGLLLAAPAMAAAALLIRLTMGSPVLFRQPRAGRHGRPFTLLKFRTMAESVGPDGKSLPDAVRLTGAGRWLRKLSLDELPQLWNVLRGEMSLVGPRPLLMDYLPRYTQHQMRRHEVTPGITGWAQVNGRNDLSWEEKFDLDVWYVDHASLWLDCWILLLTVLRTLTMQGISQQGEATAAEFKSPTRAGVSDSRGEGI